MKSKHDHASTSNCREAVITFIGCTVKGVLTGVRERGSRRSSMFTIVFDCGWGLTVLGNGSHFVETPETINNHVADLKKELTIAGI